MLFKKQIDKNFRKPAGLFGRYIIKFLEKNQTEYDELEPLLGLNKGDSVLEIGYGLGKGIYDFSQKYDCTFHGIDFSRLMYSRALRLNNEKAKLGNVILKCADFDEYDYGNSTFHCIYFLNVIYFWEETQSRLQKIFSLLNQNGKVIIFMADSERFKDYKQPENNKIFFLHSVFGIVKEMKMTGFSSVETIEHTKEKMCYYIIGHKSYDTI